jgi:hypothetical protein
MIGQAQGRAGAATPAMSGAHVYMAPAPVTVARVAPVHPAISARPIVHGGPVSKRVGVPTRTAHPAGWNHPSRRAANTFDPVFPNGNLNTDGYPVPGLGFDYTHYFATHPNVGRFHHGSGFVIPFFSGGFYLPVPGYAEDAAPAQQAEEAVADQPEPAEEPAVRESEPTARRRTRPEPAPAEQSEYVFVRRDGTLIFAVAYSWINDRLQYVTEEGLRRTAPVNALDLDATRQFNEQRGVAIRLPA